MKTKILAALLIIVILSIGIFAIAINNKDKLFPEIGTEQPDDNPDIPTNGIVLDKDYLYF